jgi:hypothetical protein
MTSRLTIWNAAANFAMNIWRWLGKRMIEENLSWVGL